MLWFYYRKPHIPIKSTRIFRLLTGAAFVNVLFDLITIYTVNHRDSVPCGVNLLAHIIYLLSILGYIFLLFLYLRSFLEVKLTFSKGIRVMHSLPVILSAIGILILPITYVHGKTTDYSLGPKAYALYGSIVVYLILILYYSLRYWESLNREKRMAIILAVPIFVGISLIQMFIPEFLLVVCASSLILLGLILSNENTEKYMDEKTSLFNQYSFETVLEEVEQAIVNKYGRENVSISSKLLWGEETGNKYRCMQNIIAFCTEIGQRFAYTDYLTHIYNRNAFERDLKKSDENREGYYIIADLNNLKVVNDSIGHSAGAGAKV